MVYLKTRPLRGSSYIPTHEKYSNPKCGLINIRNEDQECFEWCMKYHQSKKKHHYDIITKLQNIQVKYNYDGTEFPTDYSSIEYFEHINKVCILNMI